MKLEVCICIENFLLIVVEISFSFMCVIQAEFCLRAQVPMLSDKLKQRHTTLFNFINIIKLFPH